MLDNSQLQLALQEVSAGATAMYQIGRASDASSVVYVSEEFIYQTITGPLERLALLLGDESAPRAHRPRKRRRAHKPVLQALAPGQLPAPPDLGDLDLRSAWDPDERPYSPDSDPLLESSSCRALLLEIIRRASYDWVLYRTSSKLDKRMLADNAYHWLFVEEEGTPTWRQREQNDKELTSFVAICEALEIDVQQVRRRMRALTERDIMGAGRPAEKRKHKTSSDEVLHSDDLNVFDVDVSSIVSYDPMFAAEG